MRPSKEEPPGQRVLHKQVLAAGQVAGRDAGGGGGGGGADPRGGHHLLPALRRRDGQETEGT